MKYPLLLGRNYYYAFFIHVARDERRTRDHHGTCARAVNRHSFKAAGDSFYTASWIDSNCSPTRMCLLLLVVLGNVCKSIC